MNYVSFSENEDVFFYIENTNLKKKSRFLFIYLKKYSALIFKNIKNILSNQLKCHDSLWLKNIYTIVAHKRYSELDKYFDKDGILSETQNEKQIENKQRDLFFSNKPRKRGRPSKRFREINDYQSEKNYMIEKIEKGTEKGSEGVIQKETEEGAIVNEEIVVNTKVVNTKVVNTEENRKNNYNSKTNTINTININNYYNNNNDNDNNSLLGNINTNERYFEDVNTKIKDITRRINTNSNRNCFMDEPLKEDICNNILEKHIRQNHYFNSYNTIECISCISLDLLIH